MSFLEFLLFIGIGTVIIIGTMLLGFMIPVAVGRAIDREAGAWPALLGGVIGLLVLLYAIWWGLYRPGAELPSFVKPSCTCEAKGEKL